MNKDNAPWANKNTAMVGINELEKVKDRLKVAQRSKQVTVPDLMFDVADFL